jgi:hypothetical protein
MIIALKKKCYEREAQNCTRHAERGALKTYLKLATLAIMLISPAGTRAAESASATIEHGQEAQQEPQQEPQRVIEPTEFFDKKTGKVKVWYWRVNRRGIRTPFSG